LDDPLIVVRGIHFAATAMTGGVFVFLVLVAERAFGAAGALDAAIVFRASSMTSDSNFPPPMVPAMPSSKITIFVPASRGADPVTFATVARAQASPECEASSNKR
jgi:hypothetical protein